MRKLRVDHSVRKVVSKGVYSTAVDLDAAGTEAPILSLRNADSYT